LQARRRQAQVEIESGDGRHVLHRCHVDFYHSGVHHSRVHIRCVYSTTDTCCRRYARCCYHTGTSVAARRLAAPA